jgi:hypothetical protein
VYPVFEFKKRYEVDNYKNIYVYRFRYLVEEDAKGNRHVSFKGMLDRESQRMTDAFNLQQINKLIIYTPKRNVVI